MCESKWSKCLYAIPASALTSSTKGTHAQRSQKFFDSLHKRLRLLLTGESFVYLFGSGDGAMVYHEQQVSRYFFPVDHACVCNETVKIVLSFSMYKHRGDTPYINVETWKP